MVRQTVQEQRHCEERVKEREYTQFRYHGDAQHTKYRLGGGGAARFAPS